MSGIEGLLKETVCQLSPWLFSMKVMRKAYSLVHVFLNSKQTLGALYNAVLQTALQCGAYLMVHFSYLFLSGSVHYDEGESEAESMTSNMDMSNPIFQLYEAVRGARNSQGQLISEPFLQLPSRKDYPNYYHQINQPICLHQIKYGTKRAEQCLFVCYHNNLTSLMSNILCVV